ncbi:putative membrane protein [Rubricella aquisinus]|uniref:Putative membrane protein n=1 Tax=Rubricella aquisinus TaxID=2028108 RepID=A0A840WMV9_9RHOB|nr:DUF2189 domain-containing protein [Rubricella aquisinus]MBB5514992.1 putative membrane protein [Rubricella aquisinus]
MEQTHSDHSGPWRPADGVPELRAARFGDLRGALRDGWADFRRAPAIGMSIGALYMLGGWLLMWVIDLREYRGLTFPLVAGFALIGPFVATILYEISRRMERGEGFGWADIPAMVSGTARRQIIYHGFILMFWLAVWSRVGLVIYYAHFGFNPAPFWEVMTTKLFTTTGWSFLLVGHGFGAFFAFVAFAISVLAFPFLLDRDADFITAIVTSFQAVLKSPVVMLTWGALIGVILAAASLPAFAGLIVALPLLGHASWHLYRRVVLD